jgi:hypothetical protein
MKNLSRVIVFLFLLPLSTFAAKPLEVVINEIAWMGTEVKGVEPKNWWRYEWLELYNPGNQELDISGWQIENAKARNETLIISTGKIAPDGYFLICQKEIGNCHLIDSKLSLHNEYNKNGKLILRDNLGNLIDETPEPKSKEWPAGSNETKQTMERKNPNFSGSDFSNWQTSQKSGGTPNAKNGLVLQLEPQFPEKTPAETEKPLLEQKPITYPSNVLINEILPSPEGPDEKEEWIEIFNQNNFEVNLSGWKITDTTGKAASYQFPEGTKITALGFLILDRPTTKIILNNDGDGLNLIQPDGRVVDVVSYEKAPLGQSYNRTESGWVWSSTLTPGSANIIAVPITETKEVKTLEETAPPLSEEKTKEQFKEKLAAVREQINPKSPQSLFVLLVALAIAIFSGIIILILKRKIKKDYNKNV